MNVRNLARVNDESEGSSARRFLTLSHEPLSQRVLAGAPSRTMSIKPASLARSSCLSRLARRAKPPRARAPCRAGCTQSPYECPSVAALSGYFRRRALSAEVGGLAHESQPTSSCSTSRRVRFETDEAMLGVERACTAEREESGTASGQGLTSSRGRKRQVQGEQASTFPSRETRTILESARDAHGQPQAAARKMGVQRAAA